MSLGAARRYGHGNRCKSSTRGISHCKRGLLGEILLSSILLDGTSHRAIKRCS